MSDAVKSPFPAHQLVDIEPLIAPGVDWGFWLATSFWLLAGLLTLLFLLYVSRVLLRPLLFKWQLASFKKHALQQNTISKSDVYRFYAWFRKLQSGLKKNQSPRLQKDTLQKTLADLNEQVNACCFSEQTVSRETFMSLIALAEPIVKQSAGFSTLILTSSGWYFPFKRIKRWVSSWKR